jgi:hypothetical protein
MSLTISSKPNKPNRLDSQKYPNKDTNKDFHLDYAKFAVSSSDNSMRSKWIARTKINKDFYKGDQWSYQEDIETFLNDGTGQVRNRIKIYHNLIRPMVEQYRGNASILKINATARSISKMSMNRRDLALSEKIFKTRVANEFPGLGAIMRKNEAGAIGENIQETTQIFENLYVDMYVNQMNSLLKYTQHLNEFEEMQMPLALNLSLSGLVAIEAFEHGGHLRFEVIESEQTFWDSDARKSDLTDAAFCGYWKPLDVSSILESYQPSVEDALLLETFVSTAGNTEEFTNGEGTSYKATRLPVYKVFWKDIEREEYGYVMDEQGYPYLTQINVIHEGEEAPKYTDADLIDPPNNFKNKKWFKGKKKKYLYFDTLRSCTFIPGEAVASLVNKDKVDDRKNFDIVLDFGKEFYQEIENLDISNVKFPIKFQTWGYIDGEVFSPVDDAINPQRFVNRVLSATEQLINNSGGSGVIIDEDAMDPNSKSDIYHDIKEGKTVTIRTRGKGIPNTVGSYDNTPKQGVYSMFGIIPTLKQMVQDTTGVNEALRGESTGSDQLVGVTQLLIQRGSLMQEPFYSAITNVFIQCYQHAATVGKRIYIDNERELAIIAGDEGVEIIMLSKDLRNEDFRVFITRENDDAILKSQANQMLDVFMDRQLIDDKVYANLYNRSTPDDVTMALRSQAGLRIEAARRAAKEQAGMENMAVTEQEFLQERDRGDKLGAMEDQKTITKRTFF